MIQMSETSINAASAAAPLGHRPRLPDFCNLGIMARTLAILNALVVMAAFVRADFGFGGGEESLLRQFLLISAVAQPAIIFSLVAACALSRAMPKLTYWRGVSAIFALEAAIGGGFWFLYRVLAPFLSGAATIPLSVFLLFFVVATGIVLFYFDLRARSLAPAITEARLQALQARIRPHFLFNSINAVLSLIRDEPKRAERMLEDMAELFRVLMADNRQLTPLADEVTLCKRYLEIEEIRLGERLVVEWRTSTMPGEALVPPLILQPLIENAVYHGIEPLNAPGTLVIEVAAVGKQLNITLTNPFHAGSRHVSGNRMAIANIKERLQLHFDAEAGLTADIHQQRYVVKINMPIVTEASPSKRKAVA
jgi:two-component system sensor histidine kinase AlgZ